MSLLLFRMSPPGMCKSPVGIYDSPLLRRMSPRGTCRSPREIYRSPLLLCKSPVLFRRSPQGNCKSPLGTCKAPVIFRGSPEVIRTSPVLFRGSPAEGWPSREMIPSRTALAYAAQPGGPAPRPFRSAALRICRLLPMFARAAALCRWIASHTPPFLPGAQLVLAAGG